MKQLSIILMMPLIFLASCSKNKQDATFLGIGKVLLYGDPSQGATGDSIVYTFANYPQSQIETTINLKVRLVGKVAPVDRHIRLEVDVNRSTALPSEFEFDNDIVLPANAFEVIVPIKIKRSQRLKTDTARLLIRAVSTTDLIVDPVKAGNYNELVEFRIIWLDKLVQPESWPFYLWGGYSVTKHQLVIDITGVADYYGLTTDELYSAASQCNTYLDEYSKTHSGNSFVDEFGNAIWFCSTCF